MLLDLTVKNTVVVRDLNLFGSPGNSTIRDVFAMCTLIVLLLLIYKRNRSEIQYSIIPIIPIHNTIG